MIAKILLCGIFVTVAFNLAEGLNCYLCVGPQDGGCAKGDTNEMVKDYCGKNKFLTRLPKYARWEVENERHLNPACVQLAIIKGNETIYDRSCAFTPKKIDACKFIGHFMKVKDCTSCGTDYCNGK